MEHNSITPNTQLISIAYQSLKGKWKNPILASFCLVFMQGISQNVFSSVGFVGIGISFVISICIAGPFALGAINFFMAFSRDNDSRVEMIFSGFKNFQTSYLLYVRIVLICFLWSLLFVIPGIIYLYHYALSYYVLADNPALSPKEAMEISKKMMDGNKAKLFRLHLRMAGWFFLSVFTLCIGLIWLIPFFQVLSVKFYDDISKKHDINNIDIDSFGKEELFKD